MTELPYPLDRDFEKLGPDTLKSSGGMGLASPEVCRVVLTVAFY